MRCYPASCLATLQPRRGVLLYQMSSFSGQPATTSTTLGTTLPLPGTTTGGFSQPMGTPIAAASLGEDLYQTL